MTTIETHPDSREIVATFTVDVPAATVWRLRTTPEAIRQWWPCENMEMPVCDVDFRNGGAYRHVGRMGGEEHAFHGEFREIEPERRFVQTEVYEAFPGDPAEITVELTERDGRTTVVDRTAFSSPEVCQEALSRGAAHGIRESLDRLAHLAQANR